MSDPGDTLSSGAEGLRLHVWSRCGHQQISHARETVGIGGEIARMSLQSPRLFYLVSFGKSDNQLLAMAVAKPAAIWAFRAAQIFAGMRLVRSGWMPACLAQRAYFFLLVFISHVRFSITI